jgi:hypothetical protein
MRGMKTTRSLRTIAAGYALVQDLRRGHYEVTADVPVHDRVRVGVHRSVVLPMTATTSATGP